MRRAISGWSRAAVRGRRPILVGGLIVSAAVAAVAVSAPAARPVIYGVLLGAFLLIFIWSLVVGNVLNRRRPRSFEVLAGEIWLDDLWAGEVWRGDLRAGDRAFASPRLGAGVLMGVSVAPLAAFLCTILGLEIAAGRQVIESSLSIAGVLGFYAAATWSVWNPIGVRITPEAIISDRPGGTVVYPWRALDPEQPVVPNDDFVVRLKLAKPELVSRSGLTTGFNRIGFEAVDQEFATAVITHYAGEPERRAAIGTAAELDRLRAAFPGVDLATRAEHEPRMTRAGIVARLVFAGVAVALLGQESFWLEALGNVTLISVIASVIERARFKLWMRRVFRRRRATEG